MKLVTPTISVQMNTLSQQSKQNYYHVHKTLPYCAFSLFLVIWYCCSVTCTIFDFPWTSTLLGVALWNGVWETSTEIPSLLIVTVYPNLGSASSLPRKRFQSSYSANVRAVAKKNGRGWGRGEEEMLAHKPNDSGKRPLIFQSSVHL